MFIEERTKLHTSLLQFNIHIHFKLVDNILNPPENKQHNDYENTLIPYFFSPPFLSARFFQ